MRLKEFISADPNMGAMGWRQELVAGEVVTLSPRPEPLVMRGLSVFGAITGCARRADGRQRIDAGAGIGIEDEAGDHYRIADVIVSIPAKVGRRADVALIALVVPDVTDLGPEDAARLAVYRRQRTAKEILLFSADRPACLVNRRIGGEWREDLVEGTEATIRLAALGVSLFLLVAYPDLAPPGDDG